ncbi:MAG: T9SS type A sorting domain-containing protein [Bacteroidales bacterium]|nr:T9SS type A sorting domain-containing protein [Bacteroidales bacterium]
MKQRIVQLVLAVLIGTPIFAQNLSFTTGTVSPEEATTLPTRNTVDNSIQSFEVSWTFQSAIINTQKVNDETYQFLNIEGFSNFQIPGSPAIPIHYDLIAMPAGSVPEVIISEVEYFEYSGYNIHPALEPARDTEGAPEPEFFRDEEVYSKNAFFPEVPVLLSETFLLRGVPVVKMQIAPVQFNPVTGTIRVYTKLRYKLIYNSNAATFSEIAEKNTHVFTRQLQRLVLNGKNIPDGMPAMNANRENGACNYIIITHDEFFAEAEQLAEWKRQLGYTVEIVSKSSWTSAEVKSEIQTRYNMWDPHPDFFLIIGDHTGAYAVPGNIKQDPFYGDNYASDLDYACMDGNDDWHPDIAHGRISVSSALEAEIIIDKIVNYEQEPPDDPSFYANVLTCAQYQDDDNNGYADRRFTHTSEDINSYLSAVQGYTAERIYYTSTAANKTNLHYNAGYYSMGELLPAEIRTAGFNWSGGSYDITSSINDGKLIVFHRDHGYVGGSGWAHPFYTTGSMENLANGILLPVVFSINCHTGEFQLSNCFAEKLLRMENKGAVGVVAAAYYSFSGYNDAFSIGMIDAIWPNPGLYANFGSGGTGNTYTLGTTDHFLTMGEVLNQGLYAMETNWSGSSTSNKYTFNLFHWFGDPSMKLWTSNPNDQPIEATHNDEIYCDQNVFTIQNSEPGALATLLMDETLIAVQELDESGNGLLGYEITIPGEDVILTISKHNHLTYEANLQISGTCDYPPGVTTGLVINQSAGSATIGGSIDNDFGSTVTMSGTLYGTSTNLEYGQPGVFTSLTDPLVTTGAFETEISSLDPDQIYFYCAFAANGFGIGYGDISYFTSFPPIITIPYEQDFEEGGAWPSGWETNNSSVWDMRTNWHGASDPGGYHVYSDYSPSETGTVFSPVFDGTDQTNLQVSFYHYWQADYPGYTQDAYFYGSVDGGNTWPYLIDEWHHDDPSWEEAEKNYDISTWADGHEGIAFKWVVTHNNDWYWEFDDFKLESAVEAGTWLGINSNDWNDPGNWSGNTLPDEMINVTIPANPEGNFYPETNSNLFAACNNLNISLGAHLYIPADAALTVSGNLNNYAGSQGLVLQANQSGSTGSLKHFNSGVEASVERYLSQMQWHFIGSPVENAESGVFDIPGGSSIYLNAFIVGENNWGPWIASTTEPLLLGKGYECFVDDDVNRDETVVFGGLLNSGDFTTGTDNFVRLEYQNGNGLNLISNPYPCAITADIDIWARKNVAATVWTWDEEYGNYLYWNGDNGFNTEGWGTLEGGILPAMQGFFVQATGDNPIMTIPQTARVHSEQVFYKSENQIPNAIKITAEANAYQDEIIVAFNEQASESFEPERDVKKLFGLESAPQLYSISGSEKLSINVLDLKIEGTMVPLGFQINNSTTYTLNFHGKDQFDPSINIYLVDHKTRHVYDLQKSSAINFVYDLGDEFTRFSLCFGEKAIPDLTKEKAIKIFAFDNKLSVFSPAGEYNELVVYDLLGKPVYEWNYISEGIFKINLSVQPGNYLVKLLTDSESFVKKIHIH